MPFHENAPSIVIRGSRWRGLRAAAGLALMLAGPGGVIVSVPGAAPLLAVWLALLGLSAAFGAMIATAPARLELSPAGLAEQRFFGVRRWSWNEIYDFRPAEVGLASRTVGFSYIAPRGWLARLAAATTGLQASLTPGWELDPAALAAALNAARDRWLTSGSRPVRPHLAPGFVGARTGLVTYWLAVAGLMALTAGFAELGWWLAAALLVPFWVRLYAGRLHDLGWSGWWQAAAWTLGVSLTGALVSCAAPPATVADAASAIWAGFTLLVGFAPGSPAANRFGLAPGELSPMAIAEPFR